MITFDGMRNQNAQAKQYKSQKQIASDCDIGQSRYCQLMKGKAKPTYTELDKLCKAFGCQVVDLIEYKEDVNG